MKRCFYLIIRYTNKNCSMENPLSKVAADNVLEKIEQYGLEILKFSPYFFKRFIDDVLITVPANMIDHILNSFNSLDDKIKFCYRFAISDRKTK